MFDKHSFWLKVFQGEQRKGLDPLEVNLDILLTFHNAIFPVNIFDCTLIKGCVMMRKYYFSALMCFSGIWKHWILNDF